MQTAMLPFWPKYRLGHPGNYLFLFSKNMLVRSKYPKIYWFNFEKSFTGEQSNGRRMFGGALMHQLSGDISCKVSSENNQYAIASQVIICLR